MKKLKLFLNTLALFAIINTANAQNIEQEITSFVDDTEVLINNGRRMMLHYVQTRNFERVAEIHHFLNERTSEKNCAAFTLSEELHIAVLTNNWDDFFAIAEHFSDLGRINLCIPIRDNLLTEALHSEIENNASQLFENALVTGLTPKEKQLLELYFYVIEYDPDQMYRQKLRTFRRQHRQSEFDDFVTGYLPDAPPMRWGTGFSVGATQIFPTGNFSNYFAPATGANISWDGKFGKFYVGLQASFAAMRLNSPLLRSATGYHHDFLSGDRLLYTDAALLIGYTLIRNNRFELTPFVNIGGTMLESTIYVGNRNRYRYREFFVIDAFTVGPGLRTEFQLARFEWFDFWRRTSMPSSLNFRLDIGYNIPFNFNYTPARGNIFYARAGLVWWLGNF